MHAVLRERLMRRLETLPDEQLYQVLDFIEFLEAKYAEEELRREASGLQRFGERLEDSLRKRTVSPGILREAFHVISAADRVLSGVASAGKDLLGELDRAPGSGSGTTPERSSPPIRENSPDPSGKPGSTGGSRRGGDGAGASRERPSSGPSEAEGA